MTYCASQSMRIHCHLEVAGYEKLCGVVSGRNSPLKRANYFLVGDSQLFDTVL